MQVFILPYLLTYSKKILFEQSAMPTSHSLAQMKEALLLGSAERMGAEGEWRERKEWFSRLQRKIFFLKLCKNHKLSISWSNPAFAQGVSGSQHTEEVKLVTTDFTNSLLWKYEKKTYTKVERIKSGHLHTYYSSSTIISLSIVTYCIHHISPPLFRHTITTPKKNHSLTSQIPSVKIWISLISIFSILFELSLILQ